MARTARTPLSKRADDVQPHDIAKRSRQDWVSVDQIKVDKTYQRPLTKRRVDRMAAHFDPDAFGTITLSERPNGDVYVVDGQHRVACLYAMGWEDQKVPALIYTGLSREEEARMFRLMNAESTAPRSHDIFRARLTEGEPVAVEIDKIVRSVGLEINHAPGKGHVQAVATIERIYLGSSATNLLYTLRVMKDAFGALDNGHTSPYVAEVLIGIAVVLNRYGRLVDQVRLAKILARATPSGLIRDARAAAQAISATNVGLNVIPMVLVNRYNTRLAATGRLPQWEIRQSKAVWKPLSVTVVAG